MVVRRAFGEFGERDLQGGGEGVSQSDTTIRDRLNCVNLSWIVGGSGGCIQSSLWDLNREHNAPGAEAPGYYRSSLCGTLSAISIPPAVGAWLFMLTPTS